MAQGEHAKRRKLDSHTARTLDRITLKVDKIASAPTSNIFEEKVGRLFRGGWCKPRKAAADEVLTQTEIQCTDADTQTVLHQLDFARKLRHNRLMRKKIRQRKKKRYPTEKTYLHLT
ncbi:unnamed protein product [Cylicostephanus goldi]|uniref:Uncharacterized protein n=1 Tax=Cylicostephanus goldi TaxID=71465 RepID=A0A3P6SUA2_CYLGO|nr:unnamed protein product [Cylicostephanus goldi]